MPSVEYSIWIQTGENAPKRVGTHWTNNRAADSVEAWKMLLGDQWKVWKEERSLV